jgi:hypothetical protein
MRWRWQNRRRCKPGRRFGVCPMRAPTGHNRSVEDYPGFPFSGRSDCRASWNEIERLPTSRMSTWIANPSSDHPTLIGNAAHGVQGEFARRLR